MHRRAASARQCKVIERRQTDSVPVASNYSNGVIRSRRQPLQFLLALLAGWINRRQLEAIEYLKAGNRLLKERSMIC
jgi:hypothetical protein